MTILKACSNMTLVVELAVKPWLSLEQCSWYTGPGFHSYGACMSSIDPVTGPMCPDWKIGKGSRNQDYE